MENNKLNKAFRFNAVVFVVVYGGFGNFGIKKGRVCGVREYKTSYSSLLYTIEIEGGETAEFLPCNIYGSVDELIEDIKQRIAA